MSRRTAGRRVEKLLTRRLQGDCLRKKCYLERNRKFPYMGMELAIVYSSCELCVCLGDQAFCDVLGEVLGDVLGEVHGDVPSERCELWCGRMRSMHACLIPNLYRYLSIKERVMSSEEDKFATQRAKAFYLAWRRSKFSHPPTESPSNSDQLFLASSNPFTIGNSTLFKFDVLPWGLEGELKYIKQNYGNLPVCILENGQPTNQHSSINDLGRVEYLHAYIAAVLNSVRSGSDIRGYFQWSFMDMFEFINPNYTYGLYYVNFSDPKRERSPKTSALWYSALLKGKTVSLQKLKNRSMSSSPGVSCQ
ncbi:hypothetical protein DY000_02005014 [Brassica cretica]|uniref:thioglucosidase n=1 Tax=Brassica cretica TaxID=69181 RepID=A0ABQ7CID8_BRACR|nr:hypothetical protein DY000_02005014 [Brassica cretica]